MTDQFDLRKDVDLQVAFSSDGLRMPGENSIEVPLSQVIKLDRNGHLKTDEYGNYLFYKQGDNLDTCLINVGHGSLCMGTDDISTYKLVDNSTVDVKDNARYPEFASMDFCATIKPHFKPDRPNVGACEYIYIVSDQTIDFDIFFDGLEGIPYIDEIRYQVPGFYDLTNPDELVEKNVSTSSPHHHSIRVRGVDFTTSNLHDDDIIGLNVETGQILMDGVTKVVGKIKMFNKDDFARSETPELKIRVMIGSLVAKQVTGRFLASESVNLASVDFSNLPDFVRDEEVVVDVENPVVRLTLDNGVPASVSLNAVMKGIRDGREVSTLQVGKEYGTDDIAFSGSTAGSPFTRSSVWVSRVPTQLPDTVSNNVVVPAMMDLLKRVPDKVEIYAYAQTDSSQVITLELSKDYKAVPNYELVAPLKMGPNMQIVYREEIGGLHERLKDFVFDELSFATDVINRIPLNLYFEMVPLDAKGKVLENIELNVPIMIPALDTSSVVFKMRNRNGVDDLSRLNRIAVKVSALSGEKMVGQYLNKNQNLRMENIRMTIKSYREE